MKDKEGQEGHSKDKIRVSDLPIDFCKTKQNKAKQRMPFNDKITVELKGKMTTAEPSNTIKVFYHPLSVVARCSKSSRGKIFFYGKAKGAF